MATLRKRPDPDFFNFCPKFCLNDLSWDVVGLLQGSKRPLPRKPGKKSEKGFPGRLKKLEKESKTSQKPEKNLKNSHFSTPF